MRWRKVVKLSQGPNECERTPTKRLRRTRRLRRMNERREKRRDEVWRVSREDADEEKKGGKKIFSGRGDEEYGCSRDQRKELLPPE